MGKIKWSIDEKERLKEICETGWDWEFPGYVWVAALLNSDFKNNRSAASCKSMDKKLNTN